MNLATTYRPSKFEDVVGQENIVNILQNQIKTNNVKQAYLFTGPAGDGKTTMARILATELNKSSDGIVEIDAASNNGVDNIRDIRENVKFKPIGTPYRIYIIDEVHMLSTGAFNGFLKTLEEPPAHAVFILCTTDPQKIPATILSRCQRFDFNRMTVQNIVDRLEYIVMCENMNIESDTEGTADYSDILSVDSEVYEYIAKLANGGMRNGISLLDTCLGYKKHLKLEDIVDILGTTNYDVMFKLAKAVLQGDNNTIIDMVEALYEDGKDLKSFLGQFLEFVVDVAKFSQLGNFNYVKISESYKSKLEDLLEKGSIKKLMRKLIDLNYQLKYEDNVKPYIIGELMV